MSEGISRRGLIAGTGTLIVATAASQVPSPPARAAASTSPLPLAPLRIPEVDLGVGQQSDAKRLVNVRSGKLLESGSAQGAQLDQ
jgi:alpha-L-fucosidase